MLGAGRYLLGVAEIAALTGFAGVGASRIRARLLPEPEGAPAHLATIVLALALLLWVGELLGTAGLFEAGPYLAAVALVGGGIWALGPKPATPGRSRRPGLDAATLIALGVAAVAVIHFAAGVRLRLATGMTGFDSTWYHGPFAAGFFQSGDTWSLHFIAPQFLAWFYPANGEIFHAIGMAAFGRDILSPLLNLGWFFGCLLAAWCIGRPYRVAPFSLGLAAVALSVPALADQAGEARNDIVGIFFLLAAVAIAVNAWEARSEQGLPAGAIAVVGLAAGLAAGAKLNFLLPAGVVVVGLGVIAPGGARRRAFWVSGLAALAGGGYWYLRNLAHTGNPLPWIHHLGPISLPSPGQGLGGREARSVFDYLTNGPVWSNWFLPGLHNGLWLLWPLLGAMAFAGLLLCLVPFRWSSSSNSEEKEQRKPIGVLPVAGATGLAAALAWLVAPASASGPNGMPHGFESGLRYLAPALVLGMALLPVAPSPRGWLARLAKRGPRISLAGPAWAAAATGAALIVLVVGIGYPVQRHYLQGRYSNPTFTTPGLNAAFKWASAISGARIATTSTRQYPLFGANLSNQVDFVGKEQPHGGFKAPTTCRAWRRALDEGNYDYVVASRDRIEPAKPPYPPTAGWTEGPGAKIILRIPPTVVFQLRTPPDPSTCPG
ncbi:MAG TPA: hypothetical protein VII45_03425 [Solirubrobacterales bacterium]